TGSITVINSATPGGEISFDGDLTLENGGSGSQGISLQVPLSAPGHQITLSSGGLVTQSLSALITADRLLLHGSQPESRFDLTTVPNSVGQLALKFDFAKANQQPTLRPELKFGDARYLSNGPLTIAPLIGAGFVAATGQQITISAAPNSIVA